MIAFGEFVISGKLYAYSLLWFAFTMTGAMLHTSDLRSTTANRVGRVMVEIGFGILPLLAVGAGIYILVQA